MLPSPTLLFFLIGLCAQHVVAAKPREASVVSSSSSSSSVTADTGLALPKMPKLVRQDGERPLDIMDMEHMRAVLTALLEGQGTHPLSDIPGPHPAVVTHAYHEADPKADGIVHLPIGQPVSIFCHVANQGRDPLTITHVMGSLNMNNAFRYHLQNFTLAPIGHILRPGEDVTIEYQFVPKSILRPSDFQVAHTLFYVGEGKTADDDEVRYATTFFNQTVLTFQPPVAVGGNNGDEVLKQTWIGLAGLLAMVVVVVGVLCLRGEGGAKKKE